MIFNNMGRNVIAFALLLALAGAAHGFGLGLGGRFGRMGVMKGTGSGSAPSVNSRITDTGAFRITDTGASRIIAP
jgi:hypothetical protein